jgi:cyclopropane fatty-acyl-phospholipid synthase-like methyltransferase
MDFFENDKNVNEYINMSLGYDGRELIQILKKYLNEGSTLLEIGMGPGKDLGILSETFIATGSDFSTLFLELYANSHPNADLLRLDALELDTKRRFDSIYSNKVLHHLSEEDLQTSFKNQLKILNNDGIAFHSFWYGDKEENHHGLRFIYYTIEKLTKIIPKNFKVLLSKQYKELKDNDSLFIILKKI